jgi:hypothetical protein
MFSLVSAFGMPFKKPMTFSCGSGADGETRITEKASFRR